MTVRGFLFERRYISNPASKACCCPFHGDTSPSALVNDDDGTIWCFSCQKLYTPIDFRITFGVDISSEGILKRPEPEYAYKQPLFFA